MLGLIGLGIVMGVAFTVPPGIVTAETLRRGIARGFPAALGVQLGSLIGDATYALLALAGLAVMVQNPLAQKVLGVAGTLFLLYLAFSGLWQQLRPSADAMSEAAHARTSERGGAFRSGMLLSLTNPWAVGYWLSIGGVLASSGATASAGDATIFFTSFFGVCVAYAFVIAALIGWTHRTLSTQVSRNLSIVCSLLMAALALWFGYGVLQLLLAS